MANKMNIMNPDNQSTPFDDMEKAISVGKVRLPEIDEILVEEDGVVLLKSNGITKAIIPKVLHDAVMSGIK